MWSRNAARADTRASPMLGNRNYPALFPIWAAMTNLVGREEQNKYDNRSAILGHPGGTPGTGMDGPVDQSRYVAVDLQHDDHRRVPRLLPHPAEVLYALCPKLVPRPRLQESKLKAVRSPDFHFGMLRYPLMNGAKYPNQLWTAPDSGYHGLVDDQIPGCRQGYPGIHVPAQVRRAVDCIDQHPQLVEV